MAEEPFQTHKPAPFYNIMQYFDGIELPSGDYALPGILETSLSLREMKFVGEGSSGCFYATDLRGFGIVRVKLLKPDARADAWELAALRKEVAWMASMRRNIVQVYAMVISTEGAVVGLVAEYFSSGPLSSVLRQQPCPAFKQLLRVARDISAGMSYLHGKDGYHCDLKADNVFVRENDSGQLHAAIGEPSIMMVRLISRSPNNMLLDRASDVYSFGTILWEILHPGQVAFTNPTWTGNPCATSQDRPAVRKDRPAGCTVEVFEAYKSLMESCWAQDPEDRPTFLEVHMELCELFGSTCD